MEPIENLIQRVGEAVYRIQQAHTRNEARSLIRAFDGIFNAGMQLGIVSDYRMMTNDEAGAFANELMPLLSLGARDEVQREVFTFLGERGIPETITEGCKLYITKSEEEALTELVKARVADWSPQIERTLSQMAATISHLSSTFSDVLKIYEGMLAEMTNRKLVETSGYEEPEDISVIREFCGFDPAPLLLPISELLLDARLSHRFGERYTHIYEVVEFTDFELIKLENVGKESIRDFREKLLGVGLRMGMQLDLRVKKWAVLSKWKALKEIMGRHQN